MEVTVCDDVRDALERTPRIAEPAMIEATEFAEVVFRRGEEALRFCCDNGATAIHLISTRGAAPMSTCDRAVVAIATWPVDFPRLQELFASARERRLRWGIAIPVIFPARQTSAPCEILRIWPATTARRSSPRCRWSSTRRREKRSPRLLSAADDRESYEMLFHADLEPIHIATERHIAALAAEIGVADFVQPPRWQERSNWNAAILLTLAATRMIGMKRDVEIASRIARSARAVAQLDKPLERIAAAASLSIVESLDDISVDILTEWLETGRSAFVDHINKQWRLRRDVGVA